MSRPKSEDKRNAIVAAAIRVLASQGLGAPTAMIAKQAGVANGSLFNYFETKADLFNHLYLELKLEMLAAAIEGLPANAPLKEQAFHMWSGWMDWATSHPERRRLLAQLGISGEITATSRAAAQKASAPVAGLLQRCCANGPLRDQPLSFIAAIVDALAGTTMDFMIQQPTEARTYRDAGFDTLWRAVS